MTQVSSRLRVSGIQIHMIAASRNAAPVIANASAEAARRGERADGERRGGAGDAADVVAEAGAVARMAVG